MSAVGVVTDSSYEMPQAHVFFRPFYHFYTVTCTLQRVRTSVCVLVYGTYKHINCSCCIDLSKQSRYMCCRMFVEMLCSMAACFFTAAKRKSKLHGTLSVKYSMCTCDNTVMCTCNNTVKLQYCNVWMWQHSKTTILQCVNVTTQ